MLGRRTIELPSESGWDKVEQGVVDFEKLADHSDSFGNVDSAFCCLGTTRGKAGKEGFIRLVNSKKYKKYLCHFFKLSIGWTMTMFWSLPSS